MAAAKRAAGEGQSVETAKRRAKYAKRAEVPPASYGILVIFTHAVFMR